MDAAPGLGSAVGVACACGAAFAAGYFFCLHSSGAQLAKGPALPAPAAAEAERKETGAEVEAKEAVEEEEEEEEEEDGPPPAMATLEEMMAAVAEELEEEEEDSSAVPEEQALKMVCLVRKDLTMSKGKIAAQAGHAFLGCYRIAMRLPLAREWVRAWSARGCAKITLSIGTEAELLQCSQAALAAGLPSLVIEDAGRTEVAAGTRTVCAIGPAPVHLIDALTGKKGTFSCRLLE